MRTLRVLLAVVLLALGAAVLAPASPAAAVDYTPPVCRVPQTVDVPTWSGAIHTQQVEKYVMWPRVQAAIALVKQNTGHVLTIESGYRTCGEQYTLRVSNCGTSSYAIYQEPSVDCDPDTALIGASNHQYGMAVDWACDGILLRDDPTCQTIVKQYAPMAGLINYTPEVWHWGVFDENNPVGDYANDQLPVGSLDSITDVSGGEEVRGWVADPDTSGSVLAWVLVDGVIAGVQQATLNRSDVQAAGASRGSQVGFDLTVSVGAGQHQVCLQSQGNQQNRPAVTPACSTITVRGPVGTLDEVTPTSGGVHVRGWGYDPDATGSALDTKLFLDGVAVADATANVSRPDVGQATGAGNNHGYDTVLPVKTGGPHTVCVLGMDIPTGQANVSLGCKAFTLAPPVGVLDAVTPTLTGIRVQGWVLDPDATATSLPITITVDGVAAPATTANTSRPDVAAATGDGPNHGFLTELAVSSGSHTVCVAATDVPTGTFATTVGCVSLLWPSATAVNRGGFTLPQAPAGSPRRR